MTDPALDTLPEWPWPRWEFITANLSDAGAITIALAPLTEQNQISKALLHENSQLRRQQARWERRDALAQSSRPAPARRAYGN